MIIPCYNYGRYIGEAVNSVRQSTYPRIEVIVINDGSTDAYTLEILDKLAGCGVNVIHQENRGLPAARNTGFRVARGKYVLPLDADDIIDRTYIELGVWQLERHPETSFVYCYAQIFDRENYIWYTSKYNFYELLQHNYIPATALVRKSAWEEVGGYDEKMRGGYEDWEFWIRLGRCGHTGYRIADTLFYYRKHGPSMLAASNKSSRQLINYIQRKHKTLYYNPITRLKMIIGTLANKIIPACCKRLPICNRLVNIIEKGKKRILYADVHYIDMKQYARWVASNINKKIAQPNICYRWDSATGKIPVLIILPWLEVGGVEQVFYNLLSCLDRNKFSCYIITTLAGTNAWKEKFTAVTDGVFILPAAVGKSDEAGRFILDFIQSKKIKIVHISNSKLGYGIAPLIKRTRPEVKIIDLLHMDEPDQPWDYFQVSNLVKEYIDVRVVLTPYFKKLLVEKFGEQPERITVIPNGIDLSIFPTSTDPDKTRRILNGVMQIAFIGRLHRQKDPLKFLEVARQIIECNQEARFIVVGDGPLKGKMERFIAQYNLGPHIDRLGFSDDVANLLIKEIDLLVAPSVREGLPVLGLEALAAGVPVIANDVPGWDQTVVNGKTGYLIPGGAPESFTTRCIHLLCNRQKVLDMADACRQMAGLKYDRKKMAAAYENIYG